jgi:hypothetical protein
VISRILRAGDSVNDVDRAISKAISALPPSSLDRTMKDLSTAANHSLLWFTIASVLAARRGATRKAAARGVLSIGAASFLSNAVLKPLLPRRRPAASELPPTRPSRTRRPRRPSRPGIPPRPPRSRPR